MLHTKFQAPEPIGSENEAGPLARSHFAPWDLYLNKRDEGLLGNATYQILSIGAKNSKEEFFLNIFLWFKPNL